MYYKYVSTIVNAYDFEEDDDDIYTHRYDNMLIYRNRPIDIIIMITM